MDEGKDYTKNKLGYEDNTAGPGKDSYQAKGEGQYHQKPKARQDGVNQKSDLDAGDSLWGLKESEGDL